MPLLTLADLAAQLDAPVETVRHWRKRGELPPAIKIGRLVRYDPDDVARWLASRRESSAR